jgi:dihydropteroate synthase
MTDSAAQNLSVIKEPIWRLANGRTIALDRPRVMGIINATPDSFSDGGQHLDPRAAAESAARMVADGADMLDVGGESTRPGSSRIDADEQIARVVPVIKAIRNAGIGVPISVDTTLSAVASAALDAGADAINDVSGGEEDPGIVALAARREAGLVLMHRLRPPDEDAYSDRYSEGESPVYRDVVEAVLGGVLTAAAKAMSAGVPRDAIVLDPGLGFGKTVEQNLELVRRTGDLVASGFPMLGAASRKSFVGRVCVEPGDGDPEQATPPVADDRLGGSIAFSLMQLLGGVRLFRVHDVREQSRALRSAWAILGLQRP